MVLALLLAGHPLAAAELTDFIVLNQTSGGLQTISFMSPDGFIRVCLPDDLGPGDRLPATISLAALQGTTPEARTASANKLGRDALELGEQRSPVSSPTITWTLPAARPPAASPSY
ncbi:MAG: hypothetical protein EXS42_02120 [Lacunisphaera sp.]|nr:hypothetical protein [Lacunisphaera sp.]